MILKTDKWKGLELERGAYQQFLKILTEKKDFIR